MAILFCVFNTAQKYNNMRMIQIMQFNQLYIYILQRKRL